MLMAKTKHTYNNGAGTAFQMYSAEQTAYYERKHQHYNAWLMDDSREFGVPYPGFPEDDALLRKLDAQ